MLVANSFLFFVGMGLSCVFPSHVLALDLGCFLVWAVLVFVLGMGQAWGVCWMGWDGKYVALFSLCGCGRPKKIHHTPRWDLSSVLDLQLFSAPD